MNANTLPINPWIRHVALLTVVLSLLPIILGAMTTTHDAGMAFPDWPTSDGQGMFSYPWLRLVNDMGTDTKSYHKFLEHSHRLAGILIGISSMVLAILCSLKGSTRLLNFLGISVFIAVCIQGAIGGYRVWFDERGLAMIHGLFASLVFSLMCVTCTASSPGWFAAKEPVGSGRWNVACYSSLAFYIFLLVQYALGGLIRHPIGNRAPVHEHLGFGILALILVHVVMVVIIKTKTPWLRQAMRMLLIVVGLQVVLGLVTFAAKFGVASLGIVAVAQSTGQILSRTGHMVLGVLVIGAAAVLMVRCFRVRFAQKSVTTT